MFRGRFFLPSVISMLLLGANGTGVPAIEVNFFTLVKQ
jgi:hypothetical protein